MNITESIKFNKLNKEIAEKEKEIEELKQQQLYKEDFCVSFYCERDYEGGFILDVDNDMSEEDIIEDHSTEIVQKIIQLKSHSKYELLPSKEELK